MSHHHHHHHHHHQYGTTWLGGVVVRTLDLRLSVMGSIPGYDTAWLFLR